jgi:hypothetical protein
MMFPTRGIAVETWVTTSRECDVSCEVIDDQAQFVLVRQPHLADLRR